MAFVLLFFERSVDFELSRKVDSLKFRFLQKAFPEKPELVHKGTGLLEQVFVGHAIPFPASLTSLTGHLLPAGWHLSSLQKVPDVLPGGLSGRRRVLSVRLTACLSALLSCCQPFCRGVRQGVPRGVVSRAVL